MRDASSFRSSVEPDFNAAAKSALATSDGVAPVSRACESRHCGTASRNRLSGTTKRSIARQQRLQVLEDAFCHDRAPLLREMDRVKEEIRVPLTIKSGGGIDNRYAGLA